MLPDVHYNPNLISTFSTYNLTSRLLFAQSTEHGYPIAHLYITSAFTTEKYDYSIPFLCVKCLYFTEHYVTLIIHTDGYYGIYMNPTLRELFITPAPSNVYPNKNKYPRNLTVSNLSNTPLRELRLWLLLLTTSLFKNPTPASSPTYMTPWASNTRFLNYVRLKHTSNGQYTFITDTPSTFHIPIWSKMRSKRPVFLNAIL